LLKVDWGISTECGLGDRRFLRLLNGRVKVASDLSSFLLALLSSVNDNLRRRDDDDDDDDDDFTSKQIKHR